MVWLVVSALIAVQANTAMRKSEVTLPDSCKAWHKGLVSWDHVKWLINGKYYAELTQALYDTMTHTDFVVICPPASKADPFCKVWGHRPVYVRFAKGGINAALYLAALELGQAAHGLCVCVTRLADTPLFRDETGAPIKAS